MSREGMTFTEFLNSAFGFNTKTKDEIKYENELKSTKINKCPLCGGEASIHSRSECYGHGEYYTLYNVSCKNCGISLGNTYYNELEAIEAWNKLAEKKK